MGGHRRPGPIGELLRLGGGIVVPVLQTHPDRQVGQRVVRAGLIGDDIDLDAAAQQFGQHLGGIADHADGDRLVLFLRVQRESDALVEGVGQHVQVTGGQPALRADRVAFDAQHRAAVHRHGERLRAAHPAEAGGDGQRAGQPGPAGAAVVRPRRGQLLGHRGERLVGALHDALRPDVDPRPGRHLAVHGQAHGLQPAELRPVRPVPHQVRVGDQHPRRPLVGAQHANRFAGLHQQRLVLLQGGQLPADGVEAGPVAGRLAGAAVDDEVVRVLGDLGIEVVAEHPQRRLGGPALRGQRGAAGGPDRARAGRVRSGSGWSVT